MDGVWAFYAAGAKAAEWGRNSVGCWAVEKVVQSVCVKAVSSVDHVVVRTDEAVVAWMDSPRVGRKEPLPQAASWGVQRAVWRGALPVAGSKERWWGESEAGETAPRTAGERAWWWDSQRVSLAAEARVADWGIVRAGDWALSAAAERVPRPVAGWAASREKTRGARRALSTDAARAAQWVPATGARKAQSAAVATAGGSAQRGVGGKGERWDPYSALLRAPRWVGPSVHKTATRLAASRATGTAADSVYRMATSSAGYSADPSVDQKAGAWVLRKALWSERGGAAHSA
jgi:hypothetical protein